MTRPSLFSKAHLLSPVDPRRGDLLLLACCFVTGLLDCAVFNNYGVFVGMQTGNTIILCLSTASLPRSQPYAYATTLVSLASFMAGALFTSHVSTALSPLRRSTLTANFTCQTLCIIITAAITTAGILPTNNTDTGPSILGDKRVIGALPALAFQSGATIATSRLLGLGTEIPVNVLTSTYAALATDRQLFKWDNLSRNRRVGACVCVVSGALIAAWVQKKGPGIILVLWLAAGVKAVLAVAVAALMPSKEKKKEQAVEKS